VTRVQGCSRPTNEHCIGNHLLQTRRGFQHGQQFRAGLGKRVSPRWLLVRKPSRHETDNIRCDNYTASPTVGPRALRRKLPVTRQMTGRIVAGCRGTTGCPLTAARSNSLPRSRLDPPWDRFDADANRLQPTWRSEWSRCGELASISCSRSRLSHRARLLQANVTCRGPRSVLYKITRARHGSKTNTPRISLVPRCSPMSAGQRAPAGSHRAPAGPGKPVLEPAQATTLT
jgi:hypothetical protein